MFLLYTNDENNYGQLINQSINIIAYGWLTAKYKYDVDCDQSPHHYSLPVLMASSPFF